MSARQDNILHSIPASVILDSNKTALEYRLKTTYRHLLLANRVSRTFETSISLPMNYNDVRKQLVDEYRVDYDSAMSTLFDEAPEYLTGDNNMWILNATLNTTFPQFDFVDPDDDEWTLINLSTKNYNLPNDGLLIHASYDDCNFYKLNKPKNVSLSQSLDPKYIMDLILQSMRLDRTIGNDRYRILSFGDPEEVSSYTDFTKRTWINAQWLIEFADMILIMYILPLPNGPAVITMMNPSSVRDVYEWDLRKICDHIWAAYSATFEDWNVFTGSSHVPPFLSSLNFQWQESRQQISFTADKVSFSINNNVYDWSSASELFLAPSHYKLNGAIHYGVRRIVLNRDSRGKDSLSLLKRIRPDSRMPNNAQESWNDVLQERFPFNNEAVVSQRDNEGTMGAVLRTPSNHQDIRYTLYLSMENPQNESNVQRRFNALRSGITIRD